MEPFDLALRQVNFEEQDITGDDQLHSFSNLCHYDSDFKDSDSEGRPIVARQVLQNTFAPSSENPEDFEALIKRNVGAKYLRDSYQNLDMVEEPDRNLVDSVHHSSGTANYIHNYYYYKYPGSDQTANFVHASSLKQVPENQRGQTGTPSAAEMMQGTDSSHPSGPRTLMLDPHEDSFVAFTDTVEALALQKSVIGSSRITPASQDEVARVIAETQARMKSSEQTAAVSSAEQTEQQPSVKAPHPVEEDESLLITVTQQGEYSLTLSPPGGQAGQSGEAYDSQRTNQNPALASHDLNSESEEHLEVHRNITAAANQKAEQRSHDMSINHTSDDAGKYQDTGGADQSILMPDFSDLPPPRSLSQNSVDSQGKPVELIRVPQDQITTVKEKKGSWFSSGKSSASPKGAHHQLPHAQAMDNHAETGSSPQEKHGEKHGEEHDVRDNEKPGSPNPQHNPLSQKIDVPSEKANGNIQDESQEVAGQESFTSTTTQDTTLKETSRVDQTLATGSSQNITGQENVVPSTEVAKFETHESIRESTHIETSSLKHQSVSVTEVTEVAEVTEAESSSPSPKAKVMYPLTPVSPKSASLSPVENDVTPVKVQSFETHSHRTEHHSQVEHVKRVIEHVEKVTIGDVMDTPDSSFNQSADFLNQELEQALRDKAKLEGQVEVMAAELKIVIKERAELQSKLAALDQQLKSQESSTQGILGDRDALEANMKTLRQNRARMELVVMDAQKLLEDKDLEIKTLQEDLQLVQDSSEKLHDKIADLHNHIQARDNTVEDLKSKVAELYVEYQTANQNKILAESEIQSLRGEIKTLKTGKEWYQDQLHLAQQGKTDLQKQVTGVKGEMIVQGTFIEKLKADNARIKQQLTETQQRAIHEKELLARHLEAIEADMVEREATFVQIQRERENMEHALHSQDQGTERIPLDITEDLRKSKNELRRKGAQVGVLEHEQAELLKRLTLSQESILERDRDFETLEKKYVDMEVQFKQAQLDIESKEQEISRIREAKSAIEVELSAVSEEKKSFDSTLQTLKDDMGKVEQSFKHMRQELETKKQELERVKSGKQKDNEKIVEMDREKIRKEVIEELNESSELKVHERLTQEAGRPDSNADVEELRSLNAQLEKQVLSLETSSAEERKELQRLQGKLQSMESLKSVDSKDKAVAEPGLESSKESQAKQEPVSGDALEMERLGAINAQLQERIVAMDRKMEQLRLEVNSRVQDTVEEKVKSLKNSNAAEIKQLEGAKKSLEDKLDNLQEELLMLKSEKQVDDEDKAAVEKELMSAKEHLIELELGIQTITQEKHRLESDLAIVEERYSTAAAKTETASAEALEIQRVRDINTELRNKLADLQRESHKEIAKQKAKVLKLGSDLEATLRENRDTQHHLQAKVNELSAKYTNAEDARARLEMDLSDLQGHFSLNLDEKTKQLQTELQNAKSELATLQEQKQATEGELREIRHTYTQEVEIFKERISVLEVEVRTKTEQVVVQKQAINDNRQLMLELEKEKGKLAGMLQNHTTLKEHTSTLEGWLAKKESVVQAVSSNANEELLRREKEVMTLREKLKEHQELLDAEKLSLKEAKKQLKTEKGGHVKLKHKMEGLWSEHVQLQADLDQKQKELELVKSRFDEMVQKEVKYKAELESLRTELQATKNRLERLEVEMEERKAKDPVIEGQIKTLEWQIEEKTTELTAATQQLHLVEERQTTELETLRSTLQANSSELSSLREELTSTKQEKSTLQAKVVELKGALKASVQQAKSQDSPDGATDKPGSQAAAPAFDMSVIERLLQDTKPVSVQSKPLTFLQATLSGLRGEISTLQDQVDEHTSTVQHSSMAWKEIEEQVRDLREVCKSSAADRATSETILASITAAPLPPEVIPGLHGTQDADENQKSSKDSKPEEVVYV